jgi:hypothetical protein
VGETSVELGKVEAEACGDKGDAGEKDPTWSLVSMVVPGMYDIRTCCFE